MLPWELVEVGAGSWEGIAETLMDLRIKGPNLWPRVGSRSAGGYNPQASHNIRREKSSPLWRMAVGRLCLSAAGKGPKDPLWLARTLAEAYTLLLLKETKCRL